MRGADHSAGYCRLKTCRHLRGQNSPKAPNASFSA